MYGDQIGARHHALESGQILQPRDVSAVARPAEFSRDPDFVGSVRRVFMSDGLATFFFKEKDWKPLTARLS